jgi:chromosome segregation protein
MLIREVILENFMSYEYARVELKPGVNVVCGPNGSGKSSFLIGVCVALGDTYTERSKRLSDLIRWGQNRARVSLLLDNSKSSRIRPIPRFDMDVIRLTRNLRRDGKYWFEINQKSATKLEVTSILRDLGFDPGNMLIIMHQNMPTQFAALPPKEKLKTLETAVGLQTYRVDVVDAKKKLGGILSDESSINELLNRARETLGYWREQNERLQLKRQHQVRFQFLQQEMAWSRFFSLQKDLFRLENDLKNVEADLSLAEAEIERNNKLVLDAQESLKKNQATWEDLVERRIEFERTIGICEYTIRNSKDHIVQLDALLKDSGERKKRFKLNAETLKNKFKSGSTTLDDYFNLLTEIEDTQTEAYETFNAEFKEQRTDLDAQIDSLSEQLNKAEISTKNVIEEISKVRKSIEDTNNIYIDARIQMALLKDRRGRLGRRIDSLKAEIDRTKRDLNDAEAEALIRGSRVDTGRTSEEILGEMRKISGILLGLADVYEEAEAMYQSYSQTYRDLQEKMEQIQENRRKVMIEIEERTKKWSEVMKSLLDDVNSKYRVLLAMLQARGEVRLIDSYDIEEAGLEIWVGFKGAQPNRLDPYTHSGGERSTSVMAFLLSLQQNILSPFRAVDEFDLHMDPRNKEVVSEFIVNTMKGSSDQYMAITPSQISFRDNDTHLIMIHKTDGLSTIRVVE